MIFLLSPSSIANPDVLRNPRPPKPVLGRGFAIRPRGALLSPAFRRLLFEQSLTRYLVALAPFPIAMAIWPELALPISQAPVLMFGIVLFIETSVLSVPTPEKRRKLIDRDAAEAGLDRLRARGREALARIAARRDLQEGTLHLVIEQSAMARVPPFTIVSLQYEGPRGPAVLDPDPFEAALMVEGVFGDGIDERLLQRINLAENRFLRSVSIDVRSVSAHARLAALADRAQEPEPARSFSARS